MTVFINKVVTICLLHTLSTHYTHKMRTSNSCCYYISNFISIFLSVSFFTGCFKNNICPRSELLHTFTYNHSTETPSNVFVMTPRIVFIFPHPIIDCFSIYSVDSSQIYSIYGSRYHNCQ